MDKITYLKNWLSKERGNWPAIAEESEVNYWFIVRLGQGKAHNPSYSTIEKLYQYATSEKV